ncbi:unnamed protein product [Polarella glacialis]|uniref:Uncharacterized protein n=1 Tax=Polarella glacialis TaxID=89957 RepID=A0A813GJX9_POLGL|nr:unnamed protein product [Polarella glacialis]
MAWLGAAVWVAPTAARRAQAIRPAARRAIFHCQSSSNNNNSNSSSSSAYPSQHRRGAAATTAPLVAASIGDGSSCNSGDRGASSVEQASDVRNAGLDGWEQARRVWLGSGPPRVTPSARVSVHCSAELTLGSSPDRGGRRHSRLLRSSSGDRRVKSAIVSERSMARLFKGQKVLPEGSAWGSEDDYQYCRIPLGAVVAAAGRRWEAEAAAAAALAAPTPTGTGANRSGRGSSI